MRFLGGVTFINMPSGIINRINNNSIEKRGELHYGLKVRVKARFLPTTYTY